MLKSPTIIFLSILAVLALFFYSIYAENNKVNITGEYKSGLIRSRVNIKFDGIEVLDGYLDLNHNGTLNGQYKGKIVTSTCSGSETVNCIINYDGSQSLISFK
jgi:hypothetical protein